MESQIETSESAKRSPSRKKKGPSPEELARIRQRENLELSRIRVLHDLENAHNPRYAAVLRAALAHLDRELSHLC